MGLESIIQWFDGTEYTNTLPDNIIDKFTFVNEEDPWLVFGFQVDDEFNQVSFHGKAYVKAILNMTGYSLRNDLYPNDLTIICQKLEEKLENIEDREEVDQAFDVDNSDYHCTELRKWIELITEAYHVPSPREISGLLQIFRICHENNLQVYALN